MDALIGDAQIELAVKVFLREVPSLQTRLESVPDAELGGLSRKEYLRRKTLDSMMAQARYLRMEPWKYMHRLIGTDERTIEALSQRNAASVERVFGRTANGN
ncbi:MAG: hypothetical protein GAK43_01327 [Stenotrophomonas maltophilia]|nr:MAG: hypothetical protein GAK43_01327 [Stenotrophomonas maltophilia]